MKLFLFDLNSFSIYLSKEISQRDFVIQCNANFTEKLLKPQFINKYQNIFDKLINSCHFEFIIPILIRCANQKFATLF